MLKPAQLYEDDLQDRFNSIIGNLKYQYFFTTPDMTVDVRKNFLSKEDSYNFVSVENGRVIGFITYDKNYSTMAADGFGIICFEPNSFTFAADLKKAFEDLINSRIFYRIELWAYEDNPAFKKYLKLFNKANSYYTLYIHGPFHIAQRLADGYLHNSYAMELVSPEFLRTGYM